METLSISDAMNSAMWVIVLASMPVLLIAMGVGLIVGILQTATSIQEQTLAFIPKIVAVFVAILIFGPWMLRIMVEYVTNIMVNLPLYIG